MQRKEWGEVAALIHASTNAWYERHGRPPVFACAPEDLELHCRVYEALDPGCCVVAEDSESGRLLGSCFFHPRPTHVSLGIMNAHPDAFGRGVAKVLLQFVIDKADAEDKPVRLVSSAINLDSYSLYNRAGFRPYALFQDMTLSVPESGLDARPPGRDRIRSARIVDAPGMVVLERELVGIEREKDFSYLLANDEGVWRASVLEGEDGRLDGFLFSVTHAACNMLGPGLARDEAGAAALLATELDRHRSRQPVWLVPADCQGLVRQMYSWGARNCELHMAQVRGAQVRGAQVRGARVRGPVRRPRGVILPTFLPETG